MVVDVNYRPILVLPCVMSKKKVTFLHPDKVHTVEGDWAKFIKEILKYCNGSFSVADIADELDLSTLDVIEQIMILHNLGIMVDSRKQYQHFNRVDSFPTFFDPTCTQEEIEDHHERAISKFNNSGEENKEDIIDLDLIKVLSERESCRSFSKKDIPRAKILTLCHAGYSKLSTGHVTVPSAGGLYPLTLYVVVPRDMSDIRAGYYKYVPAENNLLLAKDDPDMEMIKFCFNNEDMVENTIQIIITADVDSVAYKYGNRAYRFCLIETGHVAQNITIAATEMYLGTCEMGGVLDEPIRDEIPMERNEMPLLGMVIGHPAPEVKTMNYAKFIEDNTGDDKPVKDLCIWSEPAAGFFEASVRYTDGRNWYFANGTAHSNIMASFKAVVEGYERTTVRNSDVKNSSGVAAHFDRKKAEEKALLELIERDALMHCWEEKQAPGRFSPIGAHALRREADWANKGREVTFMRPISPAAPNVPVVLVTITSESYPYFVCGAAAGTDLEEAQNKALTEAESILLYYLGSPEEGKAPKLDEINGPEDHGRLYRMSKKAARKVSWLNEGSFVDLEIEEKIEYLKKHDVLAEIEKNLDVHFRTLNQYDNGLIVIQATSPDVAEMTFGTNGQKILPHFFA